MGRSIVRRYRLLVIPFFVMVCALWLAWPRGNTSLLEVQAPARVVVRSATVVPQGVQVAWIEAEAGTRPIGGYIVERSRDSRAFTRIASTEKTSLRYLDVEGRKGDVYRVTAVDDSTPREYSGASDSVVAEEAKPGSVIDVASGISRNYDALTTQATDQSSALQQRISRAFQEFDTAVSQKDFDAARRQLPSLQNELTVLLSVRDRAEWALVSRVCTQYEAAFETDAHLLSEDDQMDIRLIQAQCGALTEEDR
ncbi:MAG TPA: hypothetical protein VJ841_02745 [Candidatus Saccharimonadales bacterium]|nr:hypothetical protein [Candidatus Saccharimonadales bacterium]